MHFNSFFILPIEYG